jgi:lipoyl(octanoyl) transferase
VRVKRLGRVDYGPTWDAMRAFTRERTASAADELWLVEHPPVYTLGQGADPAFGPASGAIPVVQTDRGGEITYHGPGQAIAYTLVDLGRRGIKVKRFVWLLEEAVLDVLGGRGARKAGAPGVYVDGAKVAALGIRVVRGRSYHGLALNVDMDLSPFNAIAPCGYPGLKVTQLSEIGFGAKPAEIADRLAERIIQRLDDA